jgi:hypothetical protein
MSTSRHTPHHGHGADDGAQDRIAFSKVIAVGVISLFVFFLGTLWAIALLHRETARVERTTGQYRPAVLGATEIGIVDQVPFTADRRLDAWKKERSDRLESYGWTNRARGIAHIPIDRAIDAVAAGALPEGAPK